MLVIPWCKLEAFSTDKSPPVGFKPNPIVLIVVEIMV